MRCTFNLKEPKKKSKTSIRLVAFFKNQNKKLVYSTGENIHPDDWDFKLKLPNNLNGRSASANSQRSIKIQLDRYSNFFTKITDLYRNTDQEITVEAIRNEFDREFKKTAKGKNIFNLEDMTPNKSSGSTKFIQRETPMIRKP